MNSARYGAGGAGTGNGKDHGSEIATGNGIGHGNGYGNGQGHSNGRASSNGLGPDISGLGPGDRTLAGYRPLPAGTGPDDWREAANVDLSVVMPVCNEEGNVPELYHRVTEVAGRICQSYELIFVDDGSTDGSFALLHDLSECDPHVRVILLARNFGHQAAVSAGLEFARGRAVAVLDSDLQDPPEFIADMYARWQEGAEVVYAVRTQRKESRVKVTCYALFYRLLRNVANVEIPLDSGDFCLMDRRVVRVLCAMPERNRFVRGIRSWVGFRQVGVKYQREARHAGQTKYGVRKLFKLAADGVLGFSLLPLRLATYLGFIVAGASVLLLLSYLLISIFVGRIQPPGFATQVILILFFGALQLIFLGALGEYVGRVLDEVRQRPHYIIWQALGFDRHAEAAASGVPPVWASRGVDCTPYEVSLGVAEPGVVKED